MQGLVWNEGLKYHPGCVKITSPKIPVLAIAKCHVMDGVILDQSWKTFPSSGSDCFMTLRVVASYDSDRFMPKRMSQSEMEFENICSYWLEIIPSVAWVRVSMCGKHLDAIIIFKEIKIKYHLHINIFILSIL